MEVAKNQPPQIKLKTQETANSDDEQQPGMYVDFLTTLLTFFNHNLCHMICY